MNTRAKNTLLIVLIIGLVSMTVAYAALSTTLRIGSSAKIASSRWDIHFENLNLVTNASSNTGTVITPAQIQPNTTQISGLVVDLKKPGDSVSYTFDIVNSGDINAKLGSLVLATPSCGGNQSACSKLEYYVKYTTGNTTPQIGDTLNKNSSVNATLTIKYKENDPLSTENDISVSGLSVTFMYAQN